MSNLATEFCFTNPKTGRTRKFYVLPRNFIDTQTHIAQITERIEDETVIAELPAKREDWQVEINKVTL